jgi:DNA mismatch endonuclease (patch repair protein)
MSRIRGKDTRPEVAFRSALWSLGLRFRIHFPLTGRPDIVFTRKRLVVFIDGCFWHGCPEHSSTPRTNREFWKLKLEKNVERDIRITETLRAEGWKIVRIWEHEIKGDIAGALKRVLDAM